MTELDLTQPLVAVTRRDPVGNEEVMHPRFVNKLRGIHYPMDVADLLACLAALPVETQVAVVAKASIGPVCGEGHAGSGCGERLHFIPYPGETVDGGSNVAIRCLDCGVALCPRCAKKHFSNEERRQTDTALRQAAEMAARASQAESALSTATARIAELEREVERLRPDAEAYRRALEMTSSLMKKPPEER